MCVSIFVLYSIHVVKLLTSSEYYVKCAFGQNIKNFSSNHLKTNHLSKCGVCILTCFMSCGLFFHVIHKVVDLTFRCMPEVEEKVRARYQFIYVCDAFLSRMNFISFLVVYQLTFHSTPFQIDEGDGAFYGPKIDISVSDAMKRKFQCATLQVFLPHLYKS